MFDLGPIVELITACLALGFVCTVVMALAWVFAWSGWTVLAVFGGLAGGFLMLMGVVLVIAWLS